MVGDSGEARERISESIGEQSTKERKAKRSGAVLVLVLFYAFACLS